MREGKLNPFSSSLVDITQFLSEPYAEGKEYSTINSYRSAISMTHSSLEGLNIGKHPVASRMMQGIFNSHPPRPRYTFVWDVSVLIEHIKSMPPSDKLNLKELTWKLLVLLAVTNADSASNLRLLDLEYRHFSQESVKFEIAGLAKTHRSAPPPPHIIYPRFEPSPTVCPVATLLEYEKRTLAL